MILIKYILISVLLISTPSFGGGPDLTPGSPVPQPIVPLTPTATIKNVSTITPIPIATSPITFARYEHYHNYYKARAIEQAAQNAAAQLKKLANNIPLGQHERPTCAYLEARFKKLGY